MKRRTRLVALVISVFMLCGMLSSCFLGNFLRGNDTDTASAAKLGEPDRYGEFKEGKYYATGDKVVELEWLVKDDSSFPLDPRSKFFDDVQTITGVKIKAVPVDSKNLQNQINLQMASGKYSDIITGAPGMIDTMLESATKGAFIPVDKLIDAYAPNIKETLAKPMYAEGKTWGTALDGRQYVIPQLRNQLGYAEHLTIRSDLLEKYGLKMPTTTDELLTVLRRFQSEAQKAAVAKGEKNKFYAFTPLGLADADRKIPYFFFNFDVANNYFVENGAVKFGPADDRFKEAVMFLNTLYKEGMMPKDVYSYSDDQYWESYYNGNIGVGLNSTSRIRMANEIYAKDKVPYKFELLKPLVTKSGARYANSESIYKGPVVISNTCKDPVAAIRLLDWFYTSDAYMLSCFGVSTREGIGMDIGEDSPMLYFSTDAADVKAKYPEWYEKEKQAIKKAIADGYKTDAFGMKTGYDAKTDELYGSFMQSMLPSSAFETRVSREYGYFNSQRMAMNAEPYHRLELDPSLPLNGGAAAVRWLDANIPPVDFNKTSLGTDGFRCVKLTPEESKELGSIEGDLWSKCDEYMAKFVTGQIGFDKWDEYIGVIKGAKYERATEIMNSGYKRFMSSTKK